MRCRGRPALLLSTLIVVGCGGESSPAPSQGGAPARTSVTGLGIEMALPEGATISSEGESARIAITGLPDLVITRSPNESGVLVSGTRGEKGSVIVQRSTKAHVWTCRADGVEPSQQSRVEALCGSMRPPEDPGVTAIRCRDQDGRIDEARESWLQERSAGLVRCWKAELAAAPRVDRGHFTLQAMFATGAEPKEEQRFATPEGGPSDPLCFERVAAELRADPGYRTGGGDGGFKCVVNLGRY